MTAAPIELSPARSAYAAAGWFGLGFDLTGITVAAVLVRRPAPMLGLLVLNAVVTGTVSLAVWRHGLRRDMAPIPHGAVVVPARFPSARLLGSIFTTGSVLALVIAGVVSPAVLGAGVGAEAGLLWGANKISAFERRDGRQVLRPLRRRLGQPAHYTDLALQPDASCSAFVIAPPRRRRAPSATHL